MRPGRHIFSYLITCLFLALMGLMIVHGAGLAAIPPLIIADSSQDHLLLLNDINGDGAYLEGSEITVIYNDSSDIPLSVPAAMLQRDDDLLLLDGGSLDTLLSLRDTNNDGFLSGIDEITALYDGGNSVPDWVYPTSLCRGPAAEPTTEGETLYVADRSTTRRRVLRLHDTDGDGLFHTPGECQVWWSTNTTPGTDPLMLPTAITPFGKESVLVADGSQGNVYRCQDIDGNGIIDDASEFSLWFSQPSDHGITTVDHLITGAHGEIYLADESAQLILCLHDHNQDGDSDDAGEVIPFSTTLAARALLAHPAGGVFLADATQDTLFHLIDLDGDQIASQPAEMITLMPTPTSQLSTPTALSCPPGWGSLHFESIQPAWVNRDGGTILEIQGDGWIQGENVFLELAGLVISTRSSFPQRLLVELPALPEGVHDLILHTDDRHGYFPSVIPVVPFFLRGDVTGDGVINLADPLRLLEWIYIPGTEPLPCLDAADSNDDELLQMIDAIWILEYLFGEGPPPLSPFPVPGPDPIAEGHGCMN
ncbi:MAG: hypothetical protein GWP39_10980 [Planctomycetia bacterium]|nr:hypothetical protein [Planctomycetia bacterium]